MQHRVIWQSPKSHSFEVTDEWDEPVEVTARPVITNYYFGTTVGFFYRSSDSFGHWYSSNATDLITAWRVTQLLPKVKTLRTRGSGYDTTLCGLVIALERDTNEKRLRNRADDLGLTLDEFNSRLEQVLKLWPDARELCMMWDKLSHTEQDRVVGRIHLGIDRQQIVSDESLLVRIEACEVRLRNAEEQKAHEDNLIKAGLAPDESLMQFLLDIGVTNMAYTLMDDFAPSHFTMQELDREIMTRLIGEWGSYSSIGLITTAKDPDDASAHLSAGGGGVTVFMNDFGVKGHPRMILGGEEMELICASWDHVTERIQITVRPLGYESEERDIKTTIKELRKRIGEEAGMPHSLAVGQSAPWTKVAADAKSGRLKRILGMD